MNKRLKSIATGAAAFAVALTAVAAVEAPAASAYTGSGAGGAPSWVAGDTFRKGAVLFFDATTGTQVSGGSNINALSVYLGTSGTAPRAGATKSTSFLAAPDPANLSPVTWATNGIQSGTTFSPAPAGTAANVASNGGAFQKLTAGNAAIEDTATGVILYSGANTDYLHILEIRIQDSGVGVTSDGGKYWATDIEYNPSNGHVELRRARPRRLEGRLAGGQHGHRDLGLGHHAVDRLARPARLVDHAAGHRHRGRHDSPGRHHPVQGRRHQRRLGDRGRRQRQGHLGVLRARRRRALVHRRSTRRPARPTPPRPRRR